MDTKKILIPIVSEHRSNRISYKKEDQQRHAFVKEREPKQLITVKIPLSLYRELKEIAFKTDDKMTPIIIRAIQEYIKNCE